jgi:uncharacterized spore protein YtfJ
MTPEEQKLIKQDHIDELFVRLENMQANASVDAVFGQPVTAGDKVVIPIASVSYGFGMGFGEATGQEVEQSNGGAGGGEGGGMGARPLGVVEITPEHTRVEPIVNEQTVTLAGMLLGAWSIFWISAAVIRIMSGRRQVCCGRASNA